MVVAEEVDEVVAEEVDEEVDKEVDEEVDEEVDNDQEGGSRRRQQEIPIHSHPSIFPPNDHWYGPWHTPCFKLRMYK